MRSQILAVVMVLSSVAFGQGLTSRDSLLSFNCKLTSFGGARVTDMKYNKAVSSKVTGVRVGLFSGTSQVVYDVNAAGTVRAGYFNPSEKSQISLSGEELKRNDYLTLLFNQKLSSGTSKNVSGKLILVTINGNVFNPQMTADKEIGYFSCQSVEVK
jgi:hypothetical protein